VNRKKTLSAPILAGLCLMLALLPSVTVSQPLPEQTEYNPWCDINDDGKIRVDDILDVSLRFGSDGNPTKPVEVTNWPDPMNVSVVSPVDENENVRVNGTCCSNSNSNETYKDVVEITVLDWVSRLYADKEWGLRVSTTVQEFPFAFNPKSKIFNVTNLYISIIGTGFQAYFFVLTIKLNDVVAWSGQEYFWQEWPGIATVHIEYPDVNQGINVIQLSVNENDLGVHRITVFIEYEYTA